MYGIAEALNYTFKDESLLITALTHPSYGSDHGVEHYQRLEFLGDAVLQMAITRHLFEKHPDVGEGRLTRARASIVCETSLAKAAEAIGVGAHIRLSVGEERSGGRKKPSILADAMEAVFGAVYLDGGAAAASRVVRRALAGQLSEVSIGERADAKSHLQILLQREQRSDPIYELIATQGPPHQPVFTVRITVDGMALGEGEGHTKQSAGQAAARAALASLGRAGKE